MKIFFIILDYCCTYSVFDLCPCLEQANMQRGQAIKCMLTAVTSAYSEFSAFENFFFSSFEIKDHLVMLHQADTCEVKYGEDTRYVLDLGIPCR